MPDDSPFAQLLSVIRKKTIRIGESSHWITSKKCAHLAMAAILELRAKGFHIVKS
jgi:hypothetical protein